jgi:hypothetical protein
MISKKLLLVILLFILPGNLEYVLHIFNGNMAIYGMYLGIMQKRNLLYLSFNIGGVFGNVETVFISDVDTDYPKFNFLTKIPLRMALTSEKCSSYSAIFVI